MISAIAKLVSVIMRLSICHIPPDSMRFINSLWPQWVVSVTKKYPGYEVALYSCCHVTPCTVVISVIWTTWLKLYHAMSTNLIPTRWISCSCYISCCEKLLPQIDCKTYLPISQNTTSSWCSHFAITSPLHHKMAQIRKECQARLLVNDDLSFPADISVTGLKSQLPEEVASRT